jgi:hypothetical protein
MPFLEGQPSATALRPTPTPDDYDPQLAALVKGMLDEGVLERSDNICNYSPLFIAWRRSVRLTHEQEALVASEGSAAALRIAEERAAAFVAAVRRLRETGPPCEGVALAGAPHAAAPHAAAANPNQAAR